MSARLPRKYELFNESSIKNIAIAVEIEGAPDILSNRAVYTKIRYGDPEIRYGDPGLIYGGLRRLDTNKPYLTLEGSSLMITQKLEPEQGKGSISQLTLSFIDKDGYMTRLISPGIVLREILGRRIKVYIGYEETSFKTDYVKIFQGRISEVQSMSGRVVIKTSDPGITSKSKGFYCPKTRLGIPLSDSGTSVTTLNNAEFPRHILGPDGLYDVPKPWNQNGTYNPIAPRRTGVRTFLKIGEEYIEYGPLGVGINSFTSCLRGSLGTIAVAHAVDSEVASAVEVTDHAMDMALKLYLGGYNGPFIENVAVRSFVKTMDVILDLQYSAIILPDQVDAVEDYGLYEGDYVTVSGSVNGNNGQARIVRFAELYDQPNRIIYCDKIFNIEYDVDENIDAVLSFRSQFDTYPITCGVKLAPIDVDIRGHIALRNSYLSGEENNYRFVISTSETMKNFIETEVYLPVSCYSITRRGQLSVGLTKPPIADENMVVLNHTNITDPHMLKPMRGLNNRKHFNEIDWDYDFSVGGNYTSLLRYVDTDAIDFIPILSILPIKSRGARTEFGSNQFFEKRSRYLLQRYKRAAVIIDAKTNWEAGCRIEAGDVVAIQDEGKLFLSNFQTGGRDLGTQLFEVIDRQLDIGTGQCTVKMVAGIDSDITDRFATISPSSDIVSGDIDHIVIQDSYGVLYFQDEMRKWKDYNGQKAVIHNADFTYYQEVTILGFDIPNPYKMYITEPPVMPFDFNGLILNIPYYPDSTDKLENSMYKAIHAHFSARVPITFGNSVTSFDVSPSDIDKFFVNSRVIVHTEFFTSTSAEVKVESITVNTITVSADLGFTPDSTYYVSGIGFKDKGGFYRWI